MKNSYHVVGVARVTGVYEGREYDNTYLHTEIPFSEKHGVGIKTVIIKIKTYNLKNDYMNYIDKYIEPYYDRYGNCVGVDVVDV